MRGSWCRERLAVIRFSLLNMEAIKEDVPSANDHSLQSTSIDDRWVCAFLCLTLILGSASCSQPGSGRKVIGVTLVDQGTRILSGPREWPEGNSRKERASTC